MDGKNIATAQMQIRHRCPPASKAGKGKSRVTQLVSHGNGIASAIIQADAGL
jgi:hypothetical protein